MAIRAYPEIYVANAMTTLGVMLDYAVNYRNEPIDYFFAAFINMGFARQFEIGNPDVITGKSGVELYRMIRCDYITPMPDYVSFERSPAFWLGWALAYAQWYTGRTFQEISGEISPGEMLLWYPTLHEADVMRFVEAIEGRFQAKKSNLQRRREAAGLSQQQLANLSGVSLRSIQMYEQKKNLIANAQFNILTALANCLGCMPMDLMDTVTPYAPEGSMDAFRLQMMRNVENYYAQIARIQSEQQRLEFQRQNQLRYNYVSQFPYQSLSYGNNPYIAQPQMFLDNWMKYWNGADAGRPLSQQQRDELMKAAKELLGAAVDQTGNRDLSRAYETYRMLTADNLMEAVTSAIKIVGQ